MDKKFCNFSVEKYELQDIKDNPNLMLLKMYIAHSGYNKNKKNRYRLFITDEAFKDAEKLFINLPVLACLNRTKTDFLEHEYELIGYDELHDEPIFNYFERIIGCIPSIDNSLHYEDISGRRYIVAYAIIWKTYCYYDTEILRNNKEQHISIEIEIVNKTINGDTMYVNKFNPTGVTIISNSIETGMFNTNSELIKFSLNNKEEIINKLNFAYKNPKCDIDKELFAKGGGNLADKKDIQIDNSKDSAIMGGSWHPNKGALFRKIKDASNAKALFKEMFAVHKIPENTDDAIESDFGYEHHSFKDGKMVLNEAGVEAAYKRGKQQNLTGESMTHIEGHRKELGLSDDNKDNFSNKEANRMVHKEKKEELKTKFSAIITENNKTNYSMLNFSEGDNNFIYCVDSSTGKIIKIPYTIGEDGSLVMDFDSIAEVYPVVQYSDNALEDGTDDYIEYCNNQMNNQMDQMTMTKEEFNKKEETLKQEFSAKEKEIEDLKAEFTQKETDLLAKNGELTVNFSAIEKELNDLKSTHETLKTDFAKKDETIAQLNDKIITFAENEKVNKAKEYLSKANFSFLTDEDKNTLTGKAKDVEFDSFEKEVFAFIGQKTINNSYADKDGKIKFSFMSLPHNDNVVKDVDKNDEVDVFNKLEKNLK